MSGSPTQRSLALMRKRGYELVAVTERWNPHAQLRQDLFGVIDVLCVGNDVVAVQTTSYSNVSARIKKISESEAFPVLRKAGVRVLVHGWRRYRGHWIVREVELQVDSRDSENKLLSLGI